MIKRNFVAKSKRPLILGVDPGLFGAISVVEIDTLDIVDMIDMPLFQTSTKSRKSGILNHLDVHKLSNLIDVYAPHVSLAVIEDVSAMPNQGLSSTFRFGQVYGQAHGVLAGHYVPVIPVKSAVWKMSLGLSYDKDVSLEVATRIFSKYKNLWKLKKNVDRAEAALMSYYGIKYLSELIKSCRK